MYYTCNKEAIVLGSTHQHASAVATATSSSFASLSFLTTVVTILTDVKPCLIGSLTLFASGRTLSTKVPVPTNLSVATLRMILCHAFVRAVTIQAKAKSVSASKAATVAMHSSSSRHDDSDWSAVENEALSDDIFLFQVASSGPLNEKFKPRGASTGWSAVAVEERSHRCRGGV